MSKVKIFFISFVLLILAGLFTSSIWLYSGKLTDKKIKWFNSLPLPAAIVNNGFIRASEVIKHLKLAEQVFGDISKITPEAKAQVYDQLLTNRKVEILTKRYGITVTEQELRDSFIANVAKYAGGDEQAFVHQLNEMTQMNKDEFIDKVIKQELLLAKLATWFYSQESKNSEAYQKARELLNKIETGTSFEEVARLESADSSANNFAGDTGFFNLKDLLPEFQENLKGVNQGQTILSPSRYGLHIIKVLGRAKGDIGEEQIQVQQIYIEGSDFSQWYKEQSDAIRTVKLLEV